ncbi:unnamed protein product [Prorocentrum cordatum]|uniref:Esterase n=1 Tax=Prorocentrum cordatum TaxID=2364126 RepID=A0ABN9RYT3_9DINO|nr:unnamed protein product [Polarella glacialis]
MALAAAHAAFRVRSSEGLRYKVTVSLPLGYDRPEEAGLRYPVVLALDAEPYLFPLLATAARTNHFFKRSSWYPSSLIPLIDSKYRTSKGDRALVGKSFGGSAVLHAMLDQECSPLFSHYLLGSPSISWDDRAFFRLEEESHKSRRPLSAAVYYAVGGREPSQPGSARDFERVLCSRGYPDLSITVDVVEGEDHGSLSYPFVCRGLNWLAASLARSRA